MSRTSWPAFDPDRIEPGDLREHDDAERIDRVWERLERNVVVGPAAAAPKRNGRASWVAAALAAGFAIGVSTSGYLLSDEADTNDGVVVAPADGEQTRTMFAAGTAPRRYALPGGGTILVEPNSIVETVSGLTSDRDDGTLRLRLVRGEATVQRREARTMSLLVGRAELTPTGSLRVRHDGDTALVQVIDGSAAVSAPHAERGMQDMVIDPDDQAMTVPVRVITASNEAKHAEPSVPPSDDGSLPPSDDEPTEVAVVAVEPDGAIADGVTPEWIKACQRGDDVAAVKQLQQSGGTLDGIDDPELLSCISLGRSFLSRAEPASAGDAAAPLLRILDGSGTDAQKGNAARELARIYRKQGKADLEAKYSQLAQEHFKDSLLFEKGLCNKIEVEHAAGNRQRVLELAETYLSQFPENGACTTRVTALAAETRAAIAEDKSDEDADGEPSDDASTSKSQPDTKSPDQKSDSKAGSNAGPKAGPKTDDSVYDERD